MTAAFLLLFACSTPVAPAPPGQALPPKYLAVEGFQACLLSESQGSYEAWCMPAARPEACAEASWAQLSALQGSDRVPACRSATP